jgi:hypothetical protein
MGGGLEKGTFSIVLLEEKGTFKKSWGAAISQSSQLHTACALPIESHCALMCPTLDDFRCEGEIILFVR